MYDFISFPTRESVLYVSVCGFRVDWRCKLCCFRVCLFDFAHYMSAHMQSDRTCPFKLVVLVLAVGWPERARNTHAA